MKYPFLYTICFVAVAGMLLCGCRKWEKHNEGLDPKASKTLLEQINETASLSRFAALLQKSGVDKLINSKTYTVYAPTNEALAALDNAVENDTAQLRRFLSNHIAVQTWLVANNTELKRIAMINGKYHNIQGAHIEDANIVVADQYAKNGVLQVIDKILPYLPNSWDFVENSADMPALEKSYLMSNFYNVFDARNAVQVGVDTLGRPVYEPGTDSVRTNIFWNNTYDIRDESKQYTTFVLTDAAWLQEGVRLHPYYTDSMHRSFAFARMIQEYAIEGAYTAAQLPDTILSRYHVKLGIAKSNIVKTIQTSNGYVHVLSAVQVRLQDKFTPIVVEAENYSFSSANRISATYKRQMLDSATGRQFVDLVVYNHGLPLFNYGYRITDVAGNQKYRAYWVAVNNSINGISAPFSQKLGIDTATSVKFFGYTLVPMYNYGEQLIGEFTLPEYRQRMNIYLTAANTTTAATNAIVCDYIKLVPVF
ncbi:Uncaracterized surface protein containing fasciclin (FAS1) repeats [Filimonas lacunae]|uniref:Uncaracterized surface protein containing fasciclin (FAS1) repeats n=1 Tax=Filimonas lacunae TaxID=477680 RepID=A0A173MHM2_9BACT|nr:fasciclin domain-containing protein [Filimonas lacunae]BAV07112.1 hypothetical protein FLA_3132 [Filimonas lacunae]SIS94853.1 Uncaracterized surface protein containing fasciclin (FAS1) repeats [Filimonas lacunae]